MVKWHPVMLAIFLGLHTGLGNAAENKEIAIGEWSKPVGDKYGNTIRGRLVICEKPRDDDRREAVVFLELQEIGSRSTRVFCDFAKTDFRPENKMGLICELLDKDKSPVKPSSSRFSGGVPQSQPISLPRDATIRLRTTPFGIHRAGSLAIAPDSNKLWAIGNDDSNEYFLSGTFTADAASSPNSTDVWQGTIELPPAKIVNRVK